MDKKKVMYIGIILLVTVITSITYFSYAFFTKKDEYHGRLNIVAGELKYKLESTDLENNSITLEANTTKEIEVEITSLNNINSEYSLYYDNSNIEVGYKEDSIDLPSGSINTGNKKKVTLIIKNKTNSSQTVIFGVRGGFSGKTVSLSNSENPVDEVLGTCPEVGTVYNFAYTGSIQTFEVPCAGKYKLEVWGAQGGVFSTYASSARNYGGYSTGDVILSEEDHLYIGVGGQGAGFTGGASAGGYNGGGTGGNGSQGGCGGGGATHIAKSLVNDGRLLRYNSNRSDILIVAGGGGGSASEGDNYIGAGGGQRGNNGGYSSKNPTYYATGATQSAGGTSNVDSGGTGGFGYGGNSFSTFGGNAGGGGYFGGGGTNRAHAGAGGGSGYIGNSSLTNKKMVCYNCTTSTATGTYTISKTCVNSTATADCAKAGSGYAKITYLGDKIVTLYSAASDEVYYYNSDNQKIFLGKTDTSGKLENVTVSEGMTLYSSVAKKIDTEGYTSTNPFSKTITASDLVNNEIRMMPNGFVVYWYGYKYDDFSNIKNVNGRTTYTYTYVSSMLPQFEANRIRIDYPASSAGTKSFAGRSASVPIDVSNYSKIHIHTSSNAGLDNTLNYDIALTDSIYPAIEAQQYADNSQTQLYCGITRLYKLPSNVWGKNGDCLTDYNNRRIVYQTSYGAWTCYIYAYWFD